MNQTSPANNVFTVPVLRSGPAYRFIMKAHGVLTLRAPSVVADWLILTTWDAAASKVMRLRLHYERNAWPARYTAIQTLCQTSVADFDLLEAGLASFSAAPLDARTMSANIIAHVNNLLRRDILVLQRLVGYETKYVQCVVAEYFIKPVDKRNAIRRSLRVLRDHIRTAVANLGAVMARLANWTVPTSENDRTGFVEQWEDQMRARIDAQVGGGVVATLAQEL